MKISWNYLQSLFEDKLDKDTVLERLTMAGLEVESEQHIAPFFSGVVVGQVVECIKHPNADKLSLCKVDVGGDELLQIVCGASNVQEGVKVPCAVVGAVLPDNFVIAERKMREVISYGMLCSGDELGYSDGVDGLLILPLEAPLGCDIREYLDLNDTIIEFKITPNRGDCLSYVGLAREIVALTGLRVKQIKAEFSYLNNLSDSISLHVIASEACKNYIGLEICEINNQVKTPELISRVLSRSGIRLISPVVDITNFVMLHLGQPMHAFDLDKIDRGVLVRFAKNNEFIKLLDGQEATLKDSTLVIANGKDEPIAIAGVTGGLDSSVTAVTKNILLESAYFEPQIIQGKSKQYGVSSDSAFRFERGVDPMLQVEAINLAAKLVADNCGGVVKSYVKFTQEYKHRNSINISITEVNKLVGDNLSNQTIMQILSSLGFEVTCADDLLTVKVPSYRFDIAIKQDIIEEIIRIYGYDKIIAKMPKLDYSLDYIDQKIISGQALKRRMVSCGYSEVINYAFIEEKYAEYFSAYYPNAVKLKNSIAGLSVMRTNLVVGLIKAMQYNLNRGYQSIKLFECGRVFHGESIDLQPIYFSGLIYGTITTLNWFKKPRLVDFYDLKNHVLNLLNGFGEIKFTTNNLPGLYHPGRSAEILLDDCSVGFMGQLHPRYAQDLSLDKLPYIFEVSMDALIKRNQSFALTNVSKYQKVSRDMAFVVDEKTKAGDLVRVIKNIGLEFLKDVIIFDVFTGDSLPINTKSIALNLIFQADYNLTDNLIVEAINTIKVELKNSLNADLR